MERGYGVSALVSPDLIAPLAEAAEADGYQTFWVNDVPGGNGLEQLARAQAATTGIRLGVGVLPVDRWSADQIAADVDRLRLDPDRLLLGIGAGAMHAGSLDATANLAGELIRLLPARVLIGALGPRMCRLAGAAAHGVILNWLTPDAATDLSLQTKEGAASVGRPTPEIIAYVRTAASPAAQSRLEKEARAYEGYPSYARHFARMGVSAIQTAVNGSAAEIAARLEAFAPNVDEVVARAIVASDDLNAYMTVLNAAKPSVGA
jgi:alkanesulfonate monooxygenase SsuD/methylene tetrahydromethanopterin reductase-like flavin-dependent oxidoreductase (luciferase family)